MDALNAIALAVGVLGLIGGTVAAWIAMRTATRVAVKIVTNSLDGIDSAGTVTARVEALEQWRRELERLAEIARRTHGQQAS